jgi:hypothetical protein
MGLIRYDIVSKMGGWSIVCNGVVGRPYLQREVALQDAAWVAALLCKTGEDVGVYLEGEPVRVDAQATAGDRRP